MRHPALPAPPDPPALTGSWPRQHGHGGGESQRHEVRGGAGGHAQRAVQAGLGFGRQGHVGRAGGTPPPTWPGRGTGSDWLRRAVRQH